MEGDLTEPPKCLDTNREVQPAPGSVIHAWKSGKWVLRAKAKVMDLPH